MEQLRRELDAKRSEGNELYKRGDDEGAFDVYTAGIQAAWAAGQVDLNADPGQSQVAQLVATLYSNRAMAALRLLQYEQVVHDASHAIALLESKGYHEWDVRPVSPALYGKARVRRGQAFAALGNMMQAHVDLRLGGPLCNDVEAQRKAFAFCDAMNHPIRYGLTFPLNGAPSVAGLSLPPPPAPRSSMNVNGALVWKLKCKLPDTCTFIQAAAWQGRIYIWGGGQADPLNFCPIPELVVVDPQAETVTLLPIKPDAASERRLGLPGAPEPRLRHTMVLWRDALYVYGGHSRAFGLLMDETESRTVWRLDLKGSPLTWQRLHNKGGACPPSRMNHAAAVWRDCMVICGGEVPSAPPTGHSSDVWLFNLEKHTWRQLATSQPLRKPGMIPAGPEPRREHACWVWKDWLYLFGGVSNKVQTETGQVNPEYSLKSFTFSDMWRFSLTKHRWERVHCEGNFPCARAEVGVAVSPRGIVYLAGGYTTAACMTVHAPNQPPDPMRRNLMSSAYSAELYEFSCEDGHFRRVLDGDMQPPLGTLRAGQAACWLDGQVFVLGGYLSLNTPVHRRSIVAIDMRACAACGARREAADGLRLQQCSRCKERRRAPVHYCSEECVSNDWPSHKLVCSATKGVLK